MGPHYELEDIDYIQWKKHHECHSEKIQLSTAPHYSNVIL